MNMAEKSSLQAGQSGLLPQSKIVAAVEFQLNKSTQVRKLTNC